MDLRVGPHPRVERLDEREDYAWRLGSRSTPTSSGAAPATSVGVRHGGPEWYERWNARNRVEGSYGVLKSLAVVNYGRDFHRFVGLARETLVTLFAVIAYNQHMLAQWRARQALTDDQPAIELPSAQPTETMPDAAAIRAGARRKPRRGPRGLEFLAGPEPPG